jgi:conjugal transfer ATP-binding protein TraC
MVKSVYKGAGWDLIDERYLQVMGLLAAMPLVVSQRVCRRTCGA